MLRRVPYKFTKRIDDANLAGYSDAVLRRPKDNPYAPGTAEHALYERAWHKAQRIMEKDDIEKGHTKLDHRFRKPRHAWLRRFGRKT